MELILTGRTMTAHEADAHGLVTRVVPAEATVDAALELAGRIAAMPPLAVRAAKAAILDADERSLERRSRARTRGVLPPVRHRGSGRGHGGLHRETPARLVGTLTASAHKEDDAWSETRRAAAMSAATTSATSATSRPDDPRRGARLPRADRRVRAGQRPRPRRPSRRRRSPRPPSTTGRAPAASSIPAFRPVGTQGLAIDDDRPRGARAHAAPEPRPAARSTRGRPGCPVVYTIDAGAFDIVVNGDHLLSWGVEPAEIQDAAMRNLARWSATAPWTDEVSGERRAVSSDTGDGWDAARILLPEVVAHLVGRARRRSGGSSSACPSGTC